MFRHFMHRRKAKHLRFHERELSDLVQKAKGDAQFMKSLEGANKMNDTQLAESFVLYVSNVRPAEMSEIILDPIA